MSPIRNPAPAAAGGWTRRGTNIELLYPTLANSTPASPGATAWTYGAYGVLSSGVANDYYPSALHVTFTLQFPIAAGTVLGGFLEIEVATGPSGSEVEIARFTQALNTLFAGTLTSAFIQTGFTFHMGPALISAGTRVVARVRTSLPTSIVNAGIVLYLSGHEAPVPPSDLTYPLDGHLAGDNVAHTRVTPLASVLTLGVTVYPAYTAWKEIIASAPNDLLVRGVSHVQLFSLGIEGKHIQFGIGAAGSEVAHSLVGCPALFPLGAGFQELRRPLLVLSGERLSFRSAGNGNPNNEYQVLYVDV